LSPVILAKTNEANAEAREMDKELPLQETRQKAPSLESGDE
jgi:hypothetical protein